MPVEKAIEEAMTRGSDTDAAHQPEIECPQFGN
jgi:hypothetical protein